MFIDDLDLDNMQRLKIAAAELLKGNPVTVYIENRNSWPERTCRKWLNAIFRDDYKLDAFSAEVLTWGATFMLSPSV